MRHYIELNKEENSALSEHKLTGLKTGRGRSETLLFSPGVVANTAKRAFRVRIKKISAASRGGRGDN
jgi:hypothetical protein